MKGLISLMWQMLVEPTPPNLLSHFTDDRTEAQMNKVGKISKKIIEKWVGKFSGLGSSPGSIAWGDLAPQGHLTSPLCRWQVTRMRAPSVTPLTR